MLLIFGAILMLLLPIILIACVGSAVGTAKEPFEGFTPQELHDRIVRLNPSLTGNIVKAMGRGYTEEQIIREVVNFARQSGKYDENGHAGFVKMLDAYIKVETPGLNRQPAPAPVAVRQPAPVVRQAPAKTRCPWCGQISADDTCPHCGGAK